MREFKLKKIYLWLIFSLILILGCWIGLISFLPSVQLNLISVSIIVLFIFIQSFIISFLFKNNNSFRKKFFHILQQDINLTFSYIIGLSTALMISASKYVFPIFMLPLLALFSYILIDKYDKETSMLPKKSISLTEEEKISRPIIEYEGKKFVFSNSSLIFFAIGTPLLAYLIYLLFDTEAFSWLHEIVVKQTVFFLNLLFNLGASASYTPVGNYHWSFMIPGKPSIYFETFCTGIQAICVFAGIIICTPHSTDKITNKDIIWRKAKSLIVSSMIFYVVNIIRMLIQIELYAQGYPWDSIHVSISAASSFIAAIIILLLHKWIPEFIISIIYIGTLINKKFKLVKPKKMKIKSSEGEIKNNK
jgi:exosortase/archaeosortase family protein